MEGGAQPRASATEAMRAPASEPSRGGRSRADGETDDGEGAEVQRLDDAEDEVRWLHSAGAAASGTNRTRLRSTGHARVAYPADDEEDCRHEPSRGTAAPTPAGVSSRRSPAAGRPASPTRRGHQKRSPRMSASAGTSTVRTTRVSSSTPTQMTTPSWASTTSGQHAEHREDGGEQDAGARDHAAGRGERPQHALAGAVPAGLLGGPGHQEDVVVDAERHQEHEREQRHAVVEALEAEDLGEEHPRQPEAGEVGRRPPSRRARSGRRPSGAAAPRATRTSSRMIGRITGRSRRWASDGVERHRPRCRRRGCPGMLGDAHRAAPATVSRGRVRAGLRRR